MNNNLVRGTKKFSEILGATELAVHPDEFVLVGLPPTQQLQVEATLSRLSGNFVQYIREPDVLTLLLPQSSWKMIEQDYPEAHRQNPINLFTFSVAMDWDVVGFLAGVTALLAKSGIPVGAVCGYYRDHLFVAGQYAKQAEAVLRQEIRHYKKRGKDR